MILDETDARRFLFLAAEELRARRRGKPPGVQPWLVDLVRRLELEVATASRSGHPIEVAEPDSASEDLISAREAAIILGLTKRQVTRLAPALGARRVDTRWLFPRSAVVEHAEGGKRDGHIA